MIESRTPFSPHAAFNTLALVAHIGDDRNGVRDELARIARRDFVKRLADCRGSLVN